MWCFAFSLVQSPTNIPRVSSHWNIRIAANLVYPSSIKRYHNTLVLRIGWSGFLINNYTMTQSREYFANLLRILKAVGIIAPALYAGTTSSVVDFIQRSDLAGVTFAYSKAVMLPLLSYSRSKIIAKQWLQAYQYGPRFVPPLVISGTICNAVLAYLSTSRATRALYIFAAAGTFSVMPITLLYMEPGINGAGKWKAQLLLRGEGLVLEEQGNALGGVTKHNATQKMRSWAETVDMKDIVTKWSRINGLRWLITGVAAAASGMASV